MVAVIVGLLAGGPVGRFRLSADRAHVSRTESAQRNINGRSAKALDTRLADARARAQRLRRQTRPPAGVTGSGAATAVPGLPGRAPGSAQAAGKAGLPGDDALIATEQAIQLDELIKWVRAQSAIEPAGPR